MAAVIIASYCGWNFTYIHGIIVVKQMVKTLLVNYTLYCPHYSAVVSLM